MIDTIHYAMGSSWFNYGKSNFRLETRDRTYPNFRSYKRGFRCIYSARQTFSKKHTLKGGPWDTQCSPNTLAYYAITFAPQRLQDIGFRCVYPVNSIYPADCRFLRGGSCYTFFTTLFRTHYRYRDYPDDRYYPRGFRCVYSVKSDD